MGQRHTAGRRTPPGRTQLRAARPLVLDLIPDPCRSSAEAWHLGDQFPAFVAGAGPIRAGGRAVSRATDARVLARRVGKAQQRRSESGEPTAEPTTTSSIDRSENRIVRELDGSLASFRQLDERVTALDDAVLALRLENVSTVHTGATVDNVLEAHFNAVLDTGGDHVTAKIEATQTNELYHIEGTIELNGRPFFRRAWELPIPAVSPHQLKAP